MKPVEYARSYLALVNSDSHTYLCGKRGVNIFCISNGTKHIRFCNLRFLLDVLARTFRSHTITLCLLSLPFERCGLEPE